MAGAVLCAGFEVWKCDFRGRRRVARGVTEVTFRGRRSTLSHVDAERFVAGAGNREVVSCGRGECRCHIERVLFGGAGIAKLLGRAA